MKTTLYNHGNIGTEEKPLIPNIIFKGLMWLVENNFKEDAEYLYSKYTLHPVQKKIYDQQLFNHFPGKEDRGG